MYDDAARVRMRHLTDVFNTFRNCNIAIKKKANERCQSNTVTLGTARVDHVACYPHRPCGTETNAECYLTIWHAGWSTGSRDAPLDGASQSSSQKCSLMSANAKYAAENNADVPTVFNPFGAQA